ncbi:MAG: hypothetical protein COA78_18800 [Blastopirellula sp.]|nr:MAG: hypothetical protein COA78_18800 [Blastopirellula sp.]
MVIWVGFTKFEHNEKVDLPSFNELSTQNSAMDSRSYSSSQDCTFQIEFECLSPGRGSEYLQ